MDLQLHLLFDYDGVLVRQRDFAGQVGQKYGVSATAIRSFFKDYLKNCLKGDGDLIDLLAANLEKIGWQGTANRLFDALYREGQIFNDALLSFIRNDLSDRYSCHLATNQEAHRWKIIKEESFVQQLFEEAFCSCDLGAVKPDISFFQEIFTRLQKVNHSLKKEEIIFIDDLWENVAAAETFGLQGHLFEQAAPFELFVQHLLAGNTFPTIRQDDFSLVKMKFSHADGYSDLLSEPGSYHFLTESGPVDQKGALAKISRNRKAFDTGRSIYWSMVDQDQRFLGFIAVHNYHLEQVAVSFGIHPSDRRKGLASRLISTLLHWDGLKGKSVEMATHQENQASYQLLFKMRFSYQGLKTTAFGQRHIFTYQSG